MNSAVTTARAAGAVSAERALNAVPQLLPLFLVSMASVGYEIALTRWFSIVSWSEYGYWVISITMVGIAASGVLKDAIAVSKMPLDTHQKGFGGHVLTGPVYIDGAEPGDMLEIRIKAVTPRVPPPWAVTTGSIRARTTLRKSP